MAFTKTRTSPQTYAEAVLYPLRGIPEAKLGRGIILSILAAKFLIGLFNYFVLKETFVLVGLEYDLELVIDPLIGWLFWLMPDVNAQHLFALLCAVLFMTAPVFCWIMILDPGVLRLPRRTEDVGRVLSIGIFALILAADFIAISYRAIQNSGGFVQKDSWDIALGVFFGLLAAALTVIVTYFSAVVYIRNANAKA